jgi:hypothetical protein
VQTIAGSAAKPAQAALLPLLARSPEQLAAANTAWNVIDSAGFCVGALLGGVLAATLGLTAGFAATAAACLLAAVIQRRLPRDAPPPHREAHPDARLVGEVLAGFRAVLADHRLRLVVAALAVTTLAEGAIDVLVVVLALDVLNTGKAGVGWLNAAWGIGGILGGGAAVALLGGGRLASGLGGGCLLVAAALAGIASWPAVAPALLLLGALGVGYALIEIAGVTLSQRLAADEVLARVLGVVESTPRWDPAASSARSRCCATRRAPPPPAPRGPGCCSPSIVPTSSRRSRGTRACSRRRTRWSASAWPHMETTRSSIAVPACPLTDAPNPCSTCVPRSSHPDSSIHGEASPKDTPPDIPLWTTNRSATRPNTSHPMHRPDVGACELAIGGNSSTVAVATRHTR